jgi:hypothetical protein
VDRLNTAALRVAVALLAFAAAAVSSAAVGGLAAGTLTRSVAVTSLAVGLVAAAFSVLSGGERVPAAASAAAPLEIAALAVLALATGRQFFSLAVSRDGEMTQLNPYNYGDLPLHWTYVAYLAQGASFWPENPIFTGTRLSYPIGADLLSALFVKLGASTGLVLRATGLLASAVLYLTLRRWGGPLAVLAFVFSGGFALSRLEPGQLLRPDDPDLAWKNALLALFVPQRGFLYALPAGLLLLSSAREKLLRGGSGLPTSLEGLLWGALPLFHMHTFLVFSLVYAAWSLLGRRLRVALPTFLTALPLGVFGAWQVTDGFAAARLVWWKPGWMMDPANPGGFLLVNFGFLLPLAIVVLLWPPHEAAAEARLVVTTALVLLVALFFVMLAPWEWDNTKALVWCVLLLPGPLPAFLASRPLRLRVPLVLLLLAPGVPAALGGFIASRPLPVLDESEKEEVCAAVAALPPSARVATAQTFNHPVALCGRAVVAGYAGHLWSHGLDARPVEIALRRLMLGAPGWEADAKALGASHVFWGSREARDFEGSTRPWARPEARLHQGPAGSLFRLD